MFARLPRSAAAALFSNTGWTIMPAPNAGFMMASRLSSSKKKTRWKNRPQAMTTLIAVDAMGGDFAPLEVVKGTCLAAKEYPSCTFALVGDEPQLQAELERQQASLANVVVQHAPDAIAMDEHPATAVRRKRKSSLVIAGQMVKSGEAQATFSAGNTGAAMAVAMLDIGRVSGIDRPAIAATLPTRLGQTLMLDAGANVDSSPQNLLQWALLGSLYAEKVLGKASPKVGLLNIGGEAGKGNELTKAVYPILQDSQLNFVGNVEGKDVFEHAADVVVCDGFAGNILLKSGEGVAEFIVSLLRKELGEASYSEETRTLFKPLLGKLLQRIDYAETGGAPLLGINGVSIIGHGRSHAKAIASGLRAALTVAQSGYVEAVRQALPALGSRQ